MLGARQPLVPLRAPLAVLPPPHPVHGLVHVAHDVEPIEPYLGLGLRPLGPDRLLVGRPHVQSHGRERRPFRRRERREVRLQAGLLPVLGHVLERRGLQIAHQRQVAGPLGHRLLVYPDAPGPAPYLPRLAPRDRALQQVPGLVPADAQDGRLPADVALPQQVDGPPLEQRREARAGLGPRQAHLPDPVGRTLHPRWAGMRTGTWLTGRASVSIALQARSGRRASIRLASSPSPLPTSSTEARAGMSASRCCASSAPHLGVGRRSPRSWVSPWTPHTDTRSGVAYLSVGSVGM
jgi:hypothetical protein